MGQRSLAAASLYEVDRGKDFKKFHCALDVSSWHSFLQLPCSLMPWCQ